MDLTQLAYFRTIAKTGSLTKAAEALSLSQPALSASLRRLEHELGVPLFDRAPNRITLNSYGELALTHAEALLRGEARMRRALLEAVEQKRSYSIAFCDSSIELYTLLHFQTAYPELPVRHSLYWGQDPLALLADRQCDLVVSPAPLEDPALECLPFLDNEALLCVPEEDPLSAKPVIFLREVASRPILMPDMPNSYLALTERLLREANPRVPLMKAHVNVIDHLMQTTRCLGFSTRLTCRIHTYGPRKVMIPLGDEALRVAYCVAFLKSSRKELGAFLTWMAGQTAGPPPDR